MTLTELRQSTSAVLTLAEAASLLQVDERTARRAADDGQIPSVRVGRRILIVREGLLAMLSPYPAGYERG